MLFNWWKKVLSKSGLSSSRRSRPLAKWNRTRLVLEALETRVTPTAYFVSTTGLDTNVGTDPGHAVRTIQQAVNLALTNTDATDQIKVEQGTYATPLVDLNITIPNTPGKTALQILGGWQTGFGTQNPTMFPTTYVFQNTLGGVADTDYDIQVNNPGVSIDGFDWVMDGTAGPGTSRIANSNGGGILVDATGTVISNNTFEVAPRGSSGTRPVAVQTGITDITGFQFTGNTVTFDAPTPGSSSAADGVFINPDTGTRTTPLIIDGNTFTGDNLGSAVVMKTASNINFTNNKVTRTGTADSFLSLIDLRQVGANQTGILIDHNDLTGNNVDASSFGILSNGTTFGSPTNTLAATITYNNITNNNGGALAIDSLTGSTLAIHDNNLSGNGSGITMVGSAQVDATRNWWGDLSGPTVASNSGGDGQSIMGTTASNILYAPWLYYSPDTDPNTAGVQLPTTLTVTAGSDSSAAVNNYRLLANAIGSAVSGQTITLSGTFDWTQPFAKAAWALGEDGQTGGAFSADDYTIAVQPGVSNVTLTAANLGGATIQGPGELLNVGQESFLTFSGGPSATDVNQNWTISNLQVFDFDLGIGMFSSGAGVDAYDNTTITNNHLREATGLNSVVNPADPLQNIGIYYSFGTNQTISNNVIDIPGNGVSDPSASPTNRSAYSNNVGTQCDTNGDGGTAYNGLQITGNTINVLHAQNTTHPQRIIGFWENSYAPHSNITISNNQFLNLDPGNNPAVNLQQAFWITAQSNSQSNTTVAYSGNTVSGARIGFKWVGDPEYPGTDYSTVAGEAAVRLWDNTITNCNTGILIQSKGLANLYRNTITGSGTGGAVDVVSGGLTGSGSVTNAVQENLITNSAGDALVIGSGAGTIGAIFDNSFDSTTGLAINNGTANLIDASGNWFGTNTAAGVAAKVSANVDYTPWLDNGNDTAKSTPGFQGDFSTLHVSAASPQAGTTGRIQEAINLVTTGGTVDITAGTYTENVTVNKQITLSGAGDGSDPTTNTIVQSATANTPVFQLTVGGTSATSRLEIENLRITGATGSSGNSSNGIDVSGGSGFTTFNTVAVVNNSGNGIGLDSPSALSDIQILNSLIDHNGGTGIRVPSASAGLNGLLIDHTKVSNNTNAGFDSNPSGTAGVAITNITISNSMFTNNNTGNDANTESIDLFAFHGNVTLQNVTVNHSNKGHAIQISGSNQGGTVGTMIFNGVTVTGTPGKTGIVVQGYANQDLSSSLSFNNVDLSGVTPGTGWSALAIEQGGPGLVNLGNTKFTALGAGHPAALAMWGAGGADATHALFVDGSDNPVTNNFTIEDSIVHALDTVGLGLVTWVANNIYVTPNTLGIQRGIDVASAGNIVNVEAGTYTGNVDVTKPITLAPGGTGITGVVDLNGNLTFSDSGATYAVDLNGPTAGTGYDQLVVSGTVNLGKATLQLNGGFSPAPSTLITLIANNSTNPVVGQFNGLPDGAPVAVGAFHGFISYVGGDGNDVTLVTAGPASYTGKANSNIFVLRRNGDLLQLYDNSVLVDQRPLGSVTDYVISGAGAGPNSLIIDLASGGYFAVGGAIYFQANNGSGNGLRVIGGQFDSSDVNYTSADAGSLGFTPSSGSPLYVAYTGTKFLDLSGNTTTNLNFRLTDGSDTLLLTDNGTGATSGLATGNNSLPPTTFQDPTTMLQLNAAAGDDALNLIRTAATTATYVLDGGAGHNSLNVNLSSTTKADSDFLTANAIFSSQLSGPIYYLATGGDFANGVTVTLGNGGNQVNIQGTQAGAATLVETGGGNDNIVVSSSSNPSQGNLSGLASSLVVDAGAGANELTVSDATQTVGGDYYVTSNAFAKQSLAVYYQATGGNFANGINFVASQANDTINVLSQLAGAPTTIYGNTGNDTINMVVTNTSAYSGLTVDGGDGSNTLLLFDESGGATFRQNPTATNSGVIVVSYPTGSPSVINYDHIAQVFANDGIQVG